MEIKYVGHMKDCRIKVGSSTFKGWKKDEVKDVSENIADILLKNDNFIKADNKSAKKKKVVEEPKEKEEIDFDLNDDGVVDGKDISIAGKVLANAKKIRNDENN